MLLINFFVCARVRARVCECDCMSVISSIIKIQFRWISQGGLIFAVQQQKNRKNYMCHTHTHGVCIESLQRMPPILTLEFKHQRKHFKTYVIVEFFME